MCVCVCLTNILRCWYKEGKYSKIKNSTKLFVFFQDLLVISYLHTSICPACCFLQRSYLAQRNANRVHNRTWTHSCFNGFKFCMGLYTGHSTVSFSPSVPVKWLFTQNWSLIFDMLYSFCYFAWCNCVMGTYPTIPQRWTRPT